MKWKKRIGYKSAKRVVKAAYSIMHVAWLALWLAVPKVRLDCKRMWDTGCARAVALGAWCTSVYFDRSDAKRVQTKIERFLYTSPLIDPRSCVIRVPTHINSVLIQVKAIVRDLLWYVRLQSPWLAMFLNIKSLSCELKERCYMIV